MADTKEKIILFLKKIVTSKCNEEGNTLLHYVVETENEEFIEYLVAAGSDVNLKNNNGDPPLACAVRNNCLKATRILLRAGANHENCHFEYSKGPLHIAAEKGFYDIVQLLIKAGADVNCKSRSATPLHAVTSCSDNDDQRCNIVKALIDAGANINAKDCWDYTPLSYSVQYSSNKIFELLLNKGADINVAGCYGNILAGTVIENQLYELKKLVEFGADIHMIDSDGNSLLHDAFKYPCLPIAEFLLDKGLAINKVNDRGFDSLCYGLESWIEPVYGDPEKEDDYDFYYKFENPELDVQIKMIDLAAKRGADLKSSLYMVLDHRFYHSSIVRALLRNGANFDYEHPIVRSLINYSDRSKLISLLLRQVALFEAQNRSDGPANFSLNSLTKQWQKDYYARCRDELELMKTSRVEDTNVSFFNILVKKDISAYTRNETIVNTFETQYVSKEFPIFSDLLIDRFTKEVLAQRLVRKAAEGLGYVLNWKESSMQLLLDIILSYLQEKDLNNLAEI